LAEVKKTTRLEGRAKWYAVYGRLDITNDFGVGHLNAAPAQLVWPTRDGYLKLR
jgi:hypothetical protein